MVCRYELGSVWAVKGEFFFCIVKSFRAVSLNRVIGVLFCVLWRHDFLKKRGLFELFCGVFGLVMEKKVIL